MALLAIGIALLASAVSADEIGLLAKHLSSPVLSSRQTTAEAQAHLASRVKPMPAIAGRAQWEKQAGVLREQILRHVIFRGQAAGWRGIPTKAEWLDTIPGNGYRIRKFRYEVVPGMWVAGLLYEPAALRGRVPVVLNLNGHEEEGMASPYIQERCVHLARNGVLAFNTEWFGRGQMSGPGFDHYRLNQIDLTGSSGLALFYLAQTRLLDIALKHPHADAARVAVTGFSGGGWQTLLLASMDLRVAAAVPVAGYSSFLTRTQFPEMDLGDSEQTPVDLGLYADYTHLTALLAPRPTLLIYNARDNCCFRADYALPPLLEAARPVFDLYGRAGRLRDHVGFDVGHNDGPDDRRALYGFLADVFFEGKGSFSTEETTSAADFRNAEELRVPVPGQKEDFHTLAARLARDLPRDGDVPDEPAALISWQSRYRPRLRELVRWPDYTVRAQEVSSQDEGGLRITASRLSLDQVWTVPSVEFAPEDPAGTTLVFGDAGRAKAGERDPVARAAPAAGRGDRPVLLRREPDRRAGFSLLSARLGPGRAASRNRGWPGGERGAMAEAEIRSGLGRGLRAPDEPGRSGGCGPGERRHRWRECSRGRCARCGSRSSATGARPKRRSCSVSACWNSST